MSEMFVPYQDPDQHWFQTGAYFDMGEYGLVAQHGQRTRTIALKNAVFQNVVLSDRLGIEHLPAHQTGSASSNLIRDMLKMALATLRIALC